MMTQEDKDLLLRDLCARIPYGVKGECKFDASYSFDMIFRYHFFDAELVGIKNDGLHVRPLIEHFVGREFANKEVADGIDINNFKPYLRPMSSMTEKEAEEYRNIDNRSYSCPMVYAHFPASERIDWLNAHHFDYRGLIEKGLALPAPEGMYNEK